MFCAVRHNTEVTFSLLACQLLCNEIYFHFVRYLLVFCTFSVIVFWRFCFHCFRQVLSYRNYRLSVCSFIRLLYADVTLTWSGPVLRQNIWVGWPLPSPIPSSPLPFSFPFPPLFPSPSSSSLPSEVGPLNTPRGLGERCKLPQRALGRAPAEIEFCAF